MSAPTVGEALAGVAPEVLAFAAEQGVTDYLAALLEMTRRIFPGAPVKALVEEDPEIANERHIALQVEVGSRTADELFAAQQRWTAELFQHCPATHVWVFRLAMV
jgi:hypothetical protein